MMETESWDPITELDENAPPEYKCPITLSIMIDPVIMPDGQTYERHAIEQALEINPISPVTRRPMEFEDAIPNYALKNLIAKYVQNYKQKKNIKSIDGLDSFEKNEKKVKKHKTKEIIQHNTNPKIDQINDRFMIQIIKNILIFTLIISILIALETNLNIGKQLFYNLSSKSFSITSLISQITEKLKLSLYSINGEMLSTRYSIISKFGHIITTFTGAITSTLSSIISVFRQTITTFTGVITSIIGAIISVPISIIGVIISILSSIIGAIISIPISIVGVIIFITGVISFTLSSIIEVIFSIIGVIFSILSSFIEVIFSIIEVMFSIVEVVFSIIEVVFSIIEVILSIPFSIIEFIL